MEPYPENWMTDHVVVGHVLRDGKVTEMVPIGSGINRVYLISLYYWALDINVPAVYKPLSGEVRKLGLPVNVHLRELAAYLVSCAAKWNIVPPTVLRSMGLSHGIGSVQLYVFSKLTRLDDMPPQQLERVAVFDELIRSMDRRDEELVMSTINGKKHVWVVDNGFAFHREGEKEEGLQRYAEGQLSLRVLNGVRNVSAALKSPHGLLRASLRMLLPEYEIDLIEARALRVLSTRSLLEPLETISPFASEGDDGV